MDIEIKIPQIEMVDLNKIQTDLSNPNKMTQEEKASLKEVIQRFGFLVPIITNKNFVIADGQHRYEVAFDLGMKQVPVIALPVDEVDRILLRQIMNKLRGTHQLAKDIIDFEKIAEGRSYAELEKYLGKKQDFFKEIVSLKNVAVEEYLLLRQVDEKEKEKLKAGSLKQITLNLTDDQKKKIIEKVGGDKIFRITEYFIMVE